HGCTLSLHDALPIFDIAARAARRPGRWNVDAIYDLFPALRELRNRQGGFLSGGEQQMLTIARTLMGNPDCCCSMSPRKGWPHWSDRKSTRLNSSHVE